MKTSIFDMNFTLPPLIGMHEVEKDMPTHKTFTETYMFVRHQSFWVQSSFNLREYLAHLVCHIMRRTCGVASAESRVFCV